MSKRVRNAPEEFEAALRRAFPTEPRPVEALSPARREDHGEFVSDIRTHIEGRAWDEVTLDDWIWMASPQIIVGRFMRPDAYRYYPPSLLLTAFGDEAREYMAIEAILPDNAKRIPKEAWWADFVSGLTREQIDAIRMFIYVLDSSEAVKPGSAEKAYLDDAIEIWIY